VGKSLWDVKVCCVVGTYRGWTEISERGLHSHVMP